MVRLLSLKTLALTFAALVALAPLLRELIGGLGLTCCSGEGGLPAAGRSAGLRSAQ
jgi:hypothetical protein